MAGSCRIRLLHPGYRAGKVPPRNCTPSRALIPACRIAASGFPLQRRRTDVSKAFIVVATISALTMPAALAQAPERPGAAGGPADSAKTVSSQIVSAQGRDEWLASQLRGTTVLGSDNPKVQDVVAILLDKSGQVRAFIVGVGGVLGLGTKEVAIDLTEFREVPATSGNKTRSEEHTSELQSLTNLVCRLLLEKKKQRNRDLSRGTLRS